jgi:hypothetical protein
MEKNTAIPTKTFSSHKSPSNPNPAPLLQLHDVFSCEGSQSPFPCQLSNGLQRMRTGSTLATSFPLTAPGATRRYQKASFDDAKRNSDWISPQNWVKTFDPKNHPLP